MSNSHDQNFKNLILDYPRQALEFFAEAEAEGIDSTVRIVPLRQEQLKERLGERFRELDVPLLIEWPGGRREAILFVLEEETEPRRFNIHRLAHYCLDLSELLETNQVVPVVIFLKTGRYQRELKLGGERNEYLCFEYLSCVLAELPTERYLSSDNIVARLNLPNMRHDSREDIIRAYTYAIRGLLTLVSDAEKRRKYLDFVDIYATLDEVELEWCRQEYPEEVKEMMGFAERFREEGLQQGLQQGLATERQLLARLIQLRFGSDCAEKAQILLSRIADTDRLAEVGEWVIKEKNGDVFLEKLQEAE